MSLSERLEKDIILALKAGNKDKLTVLRGLKSVLKYKQIDKGEKLTDEEVLSALSGSAKKCRESIEQFTKGNRTDLADKEASELKIIQEYLPAQLDEAELTKLVETAIVETGADSLQKIGLIMKNVMPKVKGKADGKQINKIAAQLLSKPE